MRNILQQPDARLREKSMHIDVFDTDLELLVNELLALMQTGPGGVGIAAPQIGELTRVILVDCSLAQHPCKHHDLLVMVNPSIEESSGRTLGREGCLSVPDWVGVVPRAKRVRVKYQDIKGHGCSIVAKGFEARVIQHEIDHLDGVLFTDRMVSTKDLVRRMQSKS